MFQASLLLKIIELHFPISTVEETNLLVFFLDISVFISFSIL